ncbi:MAG: DnaJ domain-containing protein [Bacillota bacterium]
MYRIDYYEILQVSPNASREVIEAAYKRLARIYHPDLGGDSEKMKLINEAYDILGDPQNRAAYDLSFTTDNNINENNTEVNTNETDDTETSQPTVFANIILKISLIIILLSIGLIVIVSNQYFDSDRVFYELGKLIGRSIWIVVLSFILWRYLFRKKQGTGILCFSILLLIASIYQSCLIHRDVHIESETIKEVLSVYSKMATGVEVRKTEFDKKEYGNAAPALTLLRNYASDLQTDCTNLFNEINKQNFSEVLAQDTLENPQKITEAQVTLSNVLRILDEYEMLCRQRREQLIDELEKMDVPENFKEEMIKGFNKTKDQGLNKQIEFIDIERSIVLKIRELLNFLSANQDEYFFKDGQIYFNSQEAVDSYNTYIQEISSLAEKESSWKVKFQREVFQKVKENTNFQ